MVPSVDAIQSARVDALLAFAAALVSLRLSGDLVRRYRRRRAPELAAWAAGLARVRARGRGSRVGCSCGLERCRVPRLLPRGARFSPRRFSVSARSCSSGGDGSHRSRSCTSVSRSASRSRCRFRPRSRERTSRMRRTSSTCGPHAFSRSSATRSARSRSSSSRSSRSVDGRSETPSSSPASPSPESEAVSRGSVSERLRRRSRSRRSSSTRGSSLPRSRSQTATSSPATTDGKRPRRSRQGPLRGLLATREDPQASDRVEDHQREHRVLRAERVAPALEQRDGAVVRDREASDVPDDEGDRPVRTRPCPAPRSRGSARSRPSRRGSSRARTGRTRA